MVIHRNCVSQKILGKIYLPGIFILDYSWNVCNDKYIPKIVEYPDFEIGAYYLTVFGDYISNSHYPLKCISHEKMEVLHDDLTYYKTASINAFSGRYITIPLQYLLYFKDKLIKEEHILIQDIVDYANS